MVELWIISKKMVGTTTTMNGSKSFQITTTVSHKQVASRPYTYVTDDVCFWNSGRYVACKQVIICSQSLISAY